MSKKQKTELAPVATGEISLAATAIAECNWLHSQAAASAKKAETYATNAAHLAVVLGLRLSRLKTELPHGEFGKLFSDDEKSEAKTEPWFRFEFSDRTARKYMAAAEGALERPGLKASQRNLLLGLASEAIDTTAAPADGSPAVFADAAREALEAATRGQTLRQLYLDLGIIKGDAVEKGGGAGGAGPKGGGGKPMKLPELTPEELWECLYKDGIGEVDRFFLRKEHLRLAQGRVEELIETLTGWVDDLKRLKF